MSIQVVGVRELHQVRSAGTGAAIAELREEFGLRCAPDVAAAAGADAGAGCAAARAQWRRRRSGGGTGGGGEAEAAATAASEPRSSDRRAEYERRLAEIDRKWPRRWRANVKDFVNHIDYAVKLIGIDHVGISSDFDGGGGVDGWNGAVEAFNVTLELVRRGYTEEQIGKIWSGNLLRVWGESGEGRHRDPGWTPVREGRPEGLHDDFDLVTARPSTCTSRRWFTRKP